MDISEVTSEDVAEGKVISTSPAAGKKIDKSSVVTVVVSKGKEADQQVEVPTITGKTESKAKELLKAAGLASGQASQEYSDTVDEGNIISQSPSAGTKVDKNTKVSYVISKGKNTVHVGDYRGYTKSEIESKLDGKGLKVSYTDSQYSDKYDKGTVVTHSPMDADVAAGSTISVTLSEGSEPAKTATPSRERGMM